MSLSTDFYQFIAEVKAGKVNRVQKKTWFEEAKKLQTKHCNLFKDKVYP